MQDAPQSLQVANDYLDDPSALDALYEREGYLFLRGVLDRSEIRRVAGGLTAALQSQGVVRPDASTPEWTGTPVESIDDRALYTLDSYQELVESPPTVRLLERIFGEPVYVFRSTNIRYALPNDTLHTTPAHQDNATVGPNNDFRTMWLPLIDIPTQMGGLTLARGTHRDGLLEHVPVDAQSYVLKRRQKGLPLDTITADWMTIDYEPGDALIFHSWMVHRALPNTTSTVRLSLDVRVQPADSPRSWEAQHTIPELKAYRQRVKELVTAEGRDESTFELVVPRMMIKGLNADASSVQGVLAEIERQPC